MFRIVKTKEYKEYKELERRLNLVTDLHASSVEHIRQKEEDFDLMDIQWQDQVDYISKERDDIFKRFEEYKKTFDILRLSESINMINKYMERLKKERESYTRHMEEEYQQKSKDLLEYYKLKNAEQQQEYDEMFFKQHEYSYAKYENERLKSRIIELESK